MKIKTWIKYTEGYLPTPRHRKLRYKELEDFVDIELREVSKNDTELAYIIDSTKEIIRYDGLLYRKITEKEPFYRGNSERNSDNETVLGRLKHSFVAYSTYFGFGEDDTREKMIAKAQSNMDRYILIGNDIWVVTEKPIYEILTFGMGNNHAGIGTSLHVRYGYNSNVREDCCFDAKDRDKAIEVALEVAINRGDTNSIEYIKDAPMITEY